MKSIFKQGYFIGCWLFMLFVAMPATAQKKPVVLTMELKSDIDPRASRYVKIALKEAENIKADYILIEMDTYGGALPDADAIRKNLLAFKKPVMVFINNNAASAGALISIACDSIYMAPGANIGAATVVTADGKPAPDKYQSYMRSMMRTTAEVNKRNPKLAEAMVGQPADSSRFTPPVLTLTTSEALKEGFCEGQAGSIQSVLKQVGLAHATVHTFQLSATDKVVAFFLNPVISGILMLIIIGGIYFELQTPGIGFPLIAAVTAGILYLTPYYLNGLAENWEILVLLAGLALIVLEVFVIPGFGVTGISGLVLTFVALVLIMVNNTLFDFTFVSSGELNKSLTAVAAGLIGAILLIVLTWNKISGSKSFQRMVLTNTMSREEGYQAPLPELGRMIGQVGVAFTDLRPSGKVMIADTLYEAMAREGFIQKGTAVQVTEQHSFGLMVKTLVV